MRGSKYKMTYVRPNIYINCVTPESVWLAPLACQLYGHKQKFKGLDTYTHQRNLMVLVAQEQLVQNQTENNLSCDLLHHSEHVLATTVQTCADMCSQVSYTAPYWHQS